MTDWQLGTIVGMDLFPALRVVILSLAWPKQQRETIHRSRVWQGLVLADGGETAWPVGMVITLAADMAGVIVIEEGEGA